MPLKKPSEKEERPEGLERRKWRRDFEGLKGQLQSDSPLERRWAARDLAQYPDASSILLEALKREDDISVREAILSSLMKIADETSIEGLVDLLKSDDAHLRNEAIQILKGMPDKVDPYVENLLNNPDPDLRIFAINIMESLRHPNVLKWLKFVLENDEHVNVCGAALNLLSEVGTEDVEDSVRRVKERFSHEPFIQFAANMVLKSIYESSGREA